MRALQDPLPLHRIAEAIGSDIAAESRHVAVVRLSPLDTATQDDISFLNDERYLARMRATQAAAVIVRAEHADQVPPTSVALIVADPYLAFATCAQVFADHMRGPATSAMIHPSAVIDPRALIGDRVSIGPHAVVEAGARLGDDVSIGAGCVIGAGAVIGSKSMLIANVTIYFDCELGERAFVHAGTVIGSDGFGFARDGEGWRKIPQLGRVVIGDRVEIGANCTVDRGALEDTEIGDDCILDNLVQVAHNVRLGSGCALAGCVGIAGSAVLGKRCLIGGGAGVLGHLELADDVIVSPMSLVTRSLAKSGFYSGSFPLMENSHWERAAATLRRLPDLRSRLRALETLSRKFQ